MGGYSTSSLGILTIFPKFLISTLFMPVTKCLRDNKSASQFDWISAAEPFPDIGLFTPRGTHLCNSRPVYLKYFFGESGCSIGH